MYQEQEDGYLAVHTAWIPSKFAKKGKKVRIDGMDGLWTIEDAGTTRSEDYLLKNKDNYRTHRKATDI